MDLIKAEQLEGSPANWSFGILYRCAADERWIVPMRYTNAAWTPNLAHSRAVLLSLVILGCAVVPLAIAVWTGAMREPKVALGVILCLLAFIIPPGVLARYRSS
jgi:membrane protein YqaA with SNARE-associated domain